jgi:hypothetical protein
MITVTSAHLLTLLVVDDIGRPTSDKYADTIGINGQEPQFELVTKIPRYGKAAALPLPPNISLQLPLGGNSELSDIERRR